MKCHEGSSCFEEHTASLIYGHSTSVCVTVVCLISPWRLSTWRFHRVKTCYILKMSSFLLQHFVYASARSSHTEFNLGLLLCVHIYTWIGVWYIYVHVVNAKNSSTFGEKINVTHSRTINSQHWIKVKSMLINRLNPELSRANKTKKKQRRRLKSISERFIFWVNTHQFTRSAIPRIKTLLRVSPAANFHWFFSSIPKCIVPW